MKRLFIVLMIACISLATHAQSKDEQAIKNLMGKQETAWNKGDIEAFMLGYAKNDSLLFVSKSGVNYGYQTALEHYKKGYPDTAAMGKLHFELLQLKPMGSEHYFVLGSWHLTRSIGDVGGYFTLLFKKIKGEWFIIVDHTS